MLLALLAPAAVRAQTTATAKPLPPREVFGLADDRPTPPAKPAPTAPSQRLGLALRAVPQVALAPVDLEALRAADKVRHDDGKVLRYGVGRAVRAAAQDGSWYRLADGRRLWVLDVASPGALGLRLHLRDLRLPAGAEIAVYAAADEPAAAGAAGRLALYAADQPGLGREVWTPTVLGERARIEYLAPAAGSAGLPFAIDRVQHLYLDPIARLFGKDAGSCNNDVSCYPEWANVAKAVGGLGTVFDDSSLFCTGQLLNDGAGDHTPYFLTANHCLSAPADASTAEVFWLYQTASCGGAPPSLATVPRSAEATLLATGVPSDFTLLMVEGTVPRNLFWAGWTAGAVPTGTHSAGIHHPSGDYKRISFGDRAQNPVCGGNNNNHVRVNWTNGVTEPGSSGSGIFRADTQQLYGQLHCGPSACDAAASDRNDAYGAFAATYPNISGLLAAGSDDTFAGNISCAAARGVPPGVYNNLVAKSAAPDWFRLKVDPGRTFTVSVNFNNSWGDLDLAVYLGCNPQPLATSAGSGNTESVTVINAGSTPVFFRWQVYLHDDTRNTYTMTVAVN